jgi:hypothetical protein
MNEMRKMHAKRLACMFYYEKGLCIGSYKAAKTRKGLKVLSSEMDPAEIRLIR